MDVSVKMIKKLLVVGLAGFVLMQAVPYGRSHSNPPVIREPLWDSQATRTLLKRACFDCHSFETVWPWYSSIAPASWLVSIDVDRGRRKLNFSDWKGGSSAGEQPALIAREVAEGEMPPIQYRLAHPEARLSDDEKQRLVEGIIATAARR